MIDMNDENLIALRDVPRMLPKRPTGKRLHISAVYRWRKRGIHGKKLETVTVGGTTYTSIEALQRFGVQGMCVSVPRSGEDSDCGGGC